MSAFYDLASLVLVPSGYKASKVYAQKPLTTDGQLTFSRATDATRVNASGLIETVSSNVPRLDYLGSSCPRLLLEPQRTNLVNFSEAFDNAIWGKTLTTITANDAVSPSGYQDADLATSTAGGTLFNYVTLATSTTYTASFYVKKGTAADAKYRIYNFNTGTNTVAPTSYISQTNTSTWVRVSFTFTTSATGTSYGFFVLDGASAGTMYFWGAQIEAGAYATSYIPTLGAAVTRLADACSKTGISSLIGGTSGTIFFEIKTNKTLTSTNFKQFFYYTDASASQAYMYLNGSNYLVTNPSLGNFTGSLQFQADTTYKVAIAYASNDFKLYVNGVERGSSTSGTPINALNLLSLGSYAGSAEFNEFTFAQYLHFKTRLTNAQLAELTAL